MTLQKAAQQALEALESGALLCELTAASMLRTALESEQAQAVEPATGERAMLISDLRGSADLLQIGKVEDWDGLAAEILQAVDMLEADAQEIKRLEQCRIDEAETTNKAAQASRDLLTKALNEAQQVAVPVPMTDDQMSRLFCESPEVIHPALLSTYRCGVRDAEAHHKIGANS